MKKRNHAEIQEQVDLTLGSFHTDEPPKVDPWFFERLENRIKHEETGVAKAPQVWWNQVLKPGMLVGLVALNVVMMVWITTPIESGSTGQTNYLEDLSSQFGLNYEDTYLLTVDGE